MDTEIQRGVDGLFAVCFKNYKAYNETKIKEIFGRYGDVVSIRFTGKDIMGMVFVRYKEYDATKNCLKDLNKTQELQVRMAISKLRLSDEQKQESGRYVHIFVKIIFVTNFHATAYCYMKFEVYHCNGCEEC
jgi:7-cyano-7-deazaguanine synthase in queuosine biosynthesis